MMPARSAIQTAERLAAIMIPPPRIANDNDDGDRWALIRMVARALDAAEDAYPGMPDEMSVMRKSFDYPTRSAGMNNDEIVSVDSVRVGDLRRARTLLTEKPDAP